MKTLITGLLFLGLVGFGTASAQAERQTPPDWEPILSETFGFNADTPGSVRPDALHQGCPRRDCIPAIDAPTFVPAGEAAFLADDDLVLALEIDGDARAYPAKVLNAHEIVNDTIAGRPVAVTYCPLCGSGLAFERILDGEPVEFGVSGLLHENDLVMYDRRSETLWQQITGEAILGPRAGETLQRVPLAMTEWSDWLEDHPDTRVLVGPRQAGEYETDHYADYASSNRLLFPVANESGRLGRKDVVFGFQPGGKPLAVPAAALEAGSPLEVEHGDRVLRITRHDDGAVTAADAESGRTHDGVRLYWFAWYTFHPDTAVAGGGEG